MQHSTQKIIALILGFFTSAVFASTTVALNNISEINADGNVAITLQQNKNATITYDSQNPPFTIEKGVLHIRSSPSIKKHFFWEKRAASASVSVSLSLPDIQILTLHGNASATGNNLHFANLSIFDESNGDITLNGQIGLKELTVSGKGNVDIQWVASPLLILNGYGTGKITLAGLVDKLFANLGNQQKLDAHYLRVPLLNIHTQDQATASVLPTHFLNAFAYDRSTIYYFKWPKSDNEITNAEGNVLQAAWNN